MKNGKKYCITAKGEYKVTEESNIDSTMFDSENTWNLNPKNRTGRQ